MKALKLPSEVHAARLWSDDVEKVRDNLVRLYDNTPFFNYLALESAVFDLISLGVPYEQVVRGINTIPRENVRKIYLEVLPLVDKYFCDMKPDFIQRISSRSVQLGPNLFLPVKAKFLCGIGGRLKIVWPIFWKSNPVKPNCKNFALFLELAKIAFADDPDLDDAEIEVVDFSMPNNRCSKRSTLITSEHDVETMSNDELTNCVEQLVEGFRLAEMHIQNRQEPVKSEKEQSFYSDPNQWDFFRN